jgi:putative phosphoribosyl transferase
LTVAMADPNFRDRAEAGRRLANRLVGLRSRDPVVLVRKIGAPGHPELGLGAVVDGAHPRVVLDEGFVARLEVLAAYLEEEIRRQLREVERRRERYLGGRRPIDVEDRTAIVVDDGVATGGTVRAALRGLSRARPARLILAVPVAPADTVEGLRAQADEVVCLGLVAPERFHAVGAHHDDFTQTSDAEVVALLDEAQTWSMEAVP